MVVLDTSALLYWTLAPEKLSDRVHIEPVTEMTWLKNLDLAWDHRDPADRTIAATASLLNCPLITSDQEIRSFYADAVW